MPDLLVAKSDGSLLLNRPLAPRAALVIGRAPNCQVVVPHDRASRHHGVVFEFAGEWYAVDLDSTAGLAVETGPCRLHRFTAETAWVRMGPVVVWVDGLDQPTPVSPDPGLPVETRRPPVVRTRADFVSPMPTPPATDSPSMLVAFRRRSDGAIRLLDLQGADRVVIGGDPQADVVLPDDADTPMRTLLFRVGDRWAEVDLTRREHDADRAGHRRLVPGGRIDLGAVEAAILASEPVIPRGDEGGVDAVGDGWDVPDFGSIFAAKPGENDDEEPPTRANR